MKFNKLISELKRRNVFKSTIAYLAVAWVIIQIASTVLPTFDVPEYALKALIYLLSIGLFFWIGFSWVYDLTSEGFQKTKDIIADEETVRLTNRRLNTVIVTSVLLAFLLLGIVSFWAGSQWDDDFTAPDIKRIAVIPFVQQGDHQEEYFKDGMTEELINELAKVDQLTIISQVSTRVFAAGFNPTNMLIVNEIKLVDYFVYGSIERQLNSLNVTIELKEKHDAEAIWQKEYTKDVSEVRLLWAEVAADLTRQMGIVVKLKDKQLWSNLRRVNPETYELYLKGKHYLNKSTVEDWQRGVVYFQEAIDKNPADPYAYAGMAECYIQLGHSIVPPPGVFPKALAAAQRAIQLDSTNAEGWAALSQYHTYYGWDWQLAEFAFNKANELNANMANNHYHRSWFLALFGRMNEAIDEHKRAQELDPFTPMHTAWLGELYRWVGLYEEGLAEAEKAGQMQHDYALSMLIKGRIFLDQGKNEEALEILKKASAINSGHKYMGYGPALIRTGNIKEAKEIIQELENMEPTPFYALCLYHMYFLLGDFDKGFEWINYLQTENKHAFHPWIRVLATNKALRQDPRFLALMREMNLPDPAPLVYNPDM